MIGSQCGMLPGSSPAPRKPSLVAPLHSGFSCTHLLPQSLALPLPCKFLTSPGANPGLLLLSPLKELNTDLGMRAAQGCWPRARPLIGSKECRRHSRINLIAGCRDS